MQCRLSNGRDPERLSPPNREVAFVWTLHEQVTNLYKFAHLPDNQRKESFRYGLETIKKLVDYQIGDSA